MIELQFHQTQVKHLYEFNKILKNTVQVAVDKIKAGDGTQNVKKL